MNYLSGSNDGIATSFFKANTVKKMNTIISQIDTSTSEGQALLIEAQTRLAKIQAENNLTSGFIGKLTSNNLTKYITLGSLGIVGFVLIFTGNKK